MNYTEVADNISAMEHQLQEALEMHSPAIPAFALQLSVYLATLAHDHEVQSIKYESVK